jgi:FkbM family methyltransferase
MSFIRTLARTLVERSPSVAAAYRAARDEWHAQRSLARRTPRGYLLHARQDMVDERFEPLETGLVSELLGRADVFVDLGANVGYYTCLARSVGLRCVAIEPLQSNLRFLLRNIAENGWSDVEVLPVALSDSTGVARLHGGGTGASLLRDWEGTAETFAAYVPTARLDDLLGDRFAGLQLLVKMDVEGTEAAALKGAVDTLGRTPRPMWLVEIGLAEHRRHANPWFAETFRMFLDRGYQGFAVAPEPIPIVMKAVEQWNRAGRVPVGTGNYLFLETTVVPPEWQRPTGDWAAGKS